MQTDAFPNNENTSTQSGLSKREYYIGQALVALFSKPDSDIRAYPHEFEEIRKKRDREKVNRAILIADITIEQSGLDESNLKISAHSSSMLQILKETLFAIEEDEELSEKLNNVQCKIGSLIRKIEPAYFNGDYLLNGIKK